MSTLSSPSLSARRRFVVSMLAAAMLPLTSACATEPVTPPAGVEMSVIDRESGQALQVYRKSGRSHVAGEPHARYAIRLVNRSAGRRLVVVAVDGINVISGATAGWHQSGYVLDPWQSFDITGWRKSEQEVAAFEFAALRDSYASQTGRPDNVGVIGIAVFAERSAPKVSLAPPASPRQQAPAAESAAKSLADQHGDRAQSGAAPDSAIGERRAERLGTAHGEREWSVVRTTRFERLSRSPQQVVEIAYDSFANLVAAGIIHPQVAQARPRSFPLNHGADRFVADPPMR